MASTDWPEHLRPREKLILQGASTLSDAELLAVFLRVGVTGKSAVELGHDMLAHFGSLKSLFNAPLKSFSLIHGLGPAKFAQLQAVLELAQRALAEDLKSGLHLNSPQAVEAYLRLLIGSKPYETFVVLFLNSKNCLIQTEEISKGSLTETKIYARELIKSALQHNAAAIVLAHNHPSGICLPSESDITLTRNLIDKLAVIEVKILDHFIVSSHASFSFFNNGLLKMLP